MDRDGLTHLPGTWVHVFEEDSSHGAVFRPVDADIPLSRRLRLRVELRPDGSAVLLTGGPDDRYVPQSAQWTLERDAVVVRDASDTVRMRIVEASADRLVAEMPGAGRDR